MKMYPLTDTSKIKMGKSTGKDMIVGGASLASSFMRQGLVDEVHLYILPLLFGGGKPTFPPGKEQRLQLMESRIYPEDVVILKHQFC